MSSPWKQRMPRFDLADFEDWQRPRSIFVKRIVYRNALTGMPCEVLVPTLRGRLAMLWREWRRAG